MVTVTVTAVVMFTSSVTVTIPDYILPYSIVTIYILKSIYTYMSTKTHTHIFIYMYKHTLCTYVRSTIRGRCCVHIYMRLHAYVFLSAHAFMCLDQSNKQVSA